MVNFTAKFCDSSEKLFDSNGFRKVLVAYYKKIQKRESNIYKYIDKSLDSDDTEEVVSEIIRICKLLIVLKVEDIAQMELKYKKLLSDKDKFISFVEDFYSFWRKLERYTIVHNHSVGDGLQNVSFI